MSFEAKYHGRCHECSGLIEPGDKVKHNADDLVVHDRCDDEPGLDTPGLHERHCPDCYCWHAGEECL